jgi:hypothetical protein
MSIEAMRRQHDEVDTLNQVFERTLSGAEGRDRCASRGGTALAHANLHGTKEAESRAWKKIWWQLVICRHRPAE